jgi:predicted nucleic acid-binding protein
LVEVLPLFCRECRGNKGVPISTGIHKGEAAAIALATAMQADLLLIDDRRGIRATKQ